MTARRVVVTGMGVISPVGLDLKTAWTNVVDGRSGIGPITQFDVSGSDWRVKIAGEARGFDPLEYMSAKEARRADRSVQMAVAASVEAMAQARLSLPPAGADDVGVMIGSGAGGIATYIAQQRVMDTKGPQRMHPLMIPMITVDAAGVAVAIRHGAHGPSVGLASSCATGADAIGLAFETIRRGDAAAMISGGTEAAVTPLGIAGFDNLGALTRENDRPAEASRPFDASREGFVVSEGAGVIVLESLDFTLERGAEPLAELVGYASTTDAAHLTAPDRQSTQVVRAILQALHKADLSPDDVGYVNAHAPGTPLGDPVEAEAYRKVFGDRPLPISSTKSTTGHLLGAAGAVEAIWSVQAIRDKCLPPTINYEKPDPACVVDCVPNAARSVAADVVLSSALGFGGHNAVLVFRKYEGRS
jgi:3-oxoacyl-[acyl-carrier-protein] synthase II